LMRKYLSKNVIVVYISARLTYYFVSRFESVRVYSL
jgi:hypothetical protein